MHHRTDWLALLFVWIGTVITNYFDNFTMGKLIGLATLALTILQIVRVWLQIRFERQRMRSWHNR